MAQDIVPEKSEFTYSAFRVSGSISQTVNRRGAAGTTAALTSGTLALFAIELPSSTLLTSATFVSGATALSSGTHQWFALYDSSRVLLRQTANDGSAAWPANTAKTLTFTSTFSTAYTGLYYLGICVVATTVPTLRNMVGGADLLGLAPILSGASTTGLTGTAPDPAAALTALGYTAYAYVS